MRVCKPLSPNKGAGELLLDWIYTARPFRGSRNLSKQGSGPYNEFEVVLCVF